MKILRLPSCLLLLLTLTAYALPAPQPHRIAPYPTLGGEVTRATLLRYRWLRDTELPQLLAWLREWGPFTQPPPGLLPDEVTAGLEPAEDQAAAATIAFKQ
ncbi:MAG: hypothetical protein EOO56_12430 [Hymenobacter sp.]|nr:MAG: hypothetical protein EOO56_12430 [Hymenobacter sp.]